MPSSSDGGNSMRNQVYDWTGIMEQVGARHHTLFESLETANFDHLVQHYTASANPYETLADYMLFGAAAVLGRDRQASEAVLTYHGRLNDKTKAVTLVFWAEEAIAHQQYPTAEGFIAPLLATFNRDPHLNALMASCCFYQQNLAKGWSYLKTGLESDPQSFELHSLLCRYHLNEGDMEAAKKAALTLLDLDPLNQVAFNILSRIAPTDIDDNLLLRFEHRALEGAVRPTNCAAMFFDLGRIYDARGLYEKAFDVVARANEQMKSIPQVAGRRFSAEQEYQKFVDRCGLYDQLTPNDEATAFTPIFIVGLPRTGSTLLDQALSAHPECVSLGEDNIIPTIAEEAEELLRAGRTAEAQARIPDWQKRFIERATEEFLKKSAEGAPNRPLKFVIDKMLGNSRHIGLISKLFPQAVYLNSCRNVMDVGLSIYFSPLHRVNLYATDLEAIGDFIVLEKRLIAFWKQRDFNVLPVHYEDMVDAMEPTLKQVMQHVGIDWHENCLHFQDHKRAVHTYSAHQVRKTIYSSSKGRWQNYSSQMAPLRAALQAGKLPQNVTAAHVA